MIEILEVSMGKASKKWIACVIFALTAVLLLSGCELFHYGSETPDVSLSTPRPMENTMYQVKKSNIAVDFNGMAKVTSLNGVRYAFDYSGAYVEKIHVNVGQNVKAGDVLVTLNSTELRQALSAAEDILRYQQTLYNEAVAANGENSSSANAVRIDYNEALNRRNALQAQLDNYTLTAEKDGVVRYVNPKFTKMEDPNVTVTAGEVMVVVDPEILSESFAVFELSVNALSTYHIDLGSEFSMYKINNTAGAEAERFKGKVVSTSRLPNPGDEVPVTSVTFYIGLENAPEGIAVGDSLSVTYVEDEANDCLIIPLSALYSFGGRDFVYMIDSQGLLRECYVKTGLRNDIFVEIVSGLEEGDVIVQY